MTLTTPSPLQDAIDRLVASARRHGVSNGQNGPFRHHVMSNTGPDAERTRVPARGGARDRWISVTGEPGFVGETSSLWVGDMRLTYFASQGGWTMEFDPDPDYVAVLHALQGERTYAVDGVPVRVARPGDHVFVLNKSPLFQITSPGSSAGFTAFIPIPPDHHSALAQRLGVGAQLRPFLDNGFVISGPSPLWNIHLTYALNHALDLTDTDAKGEEAPQEMPKSGDLLSEHLYLMFCQELANRAEQRDADQQHVAVPLKLKVAENYIAANAASAPTVEAVAGTAGLSVHGLQTLFRKFRGTSPRAFIRERRLTGVRAALGKAVAGATVTEIAAAWGFQDFGNFTSAYRERFGELPSETLARG